MNVPTVWIGLLNVKPRKGNDLTDGSHSFVTVVALGKDANDYTEIAIRLLNAMDFDVLEVEDVEPWSVRIQKGSPDQEIRDLVAGLTNENWAAYSTFYSYDPESE